MPNQIANPPPKGIGFAWTLRAFGSSIGPQRRAQWRIMKPAASEISKLGSVAPRINQITAGPPGPRLAGTRSRQATKNS